MYNRGREIDRSLLCRGWIRRKLAADMTRMKAFQPWVMAVARGIMWLTLLAAMLLPAGLACASGRTVRVGYYMFDGYQMQDADGMRSGYGYDFLQELARYTGWQYEYVGYELGWAKLQQMLDAGEIDILTSARKTPQREQQYLFSSSMGTSAGILTVKTGDERLTMGDYATYAGIRVGMIKDSSINENFRQFAAAKGFSYTPVYFANADEMNAALQAGDGIDAVCTTNLRRIKNEWVLDQFDAADFYVMMRGDRTILQQEANAGIKQMDLFTPGWRTTLWNRYYTPDVGNQIALTSEEKAFLRQAAEQGYVFTAIVDPERMPYSYFEDGEARGIIPEIFAEVARRTGISFRIVETPDRAAYLSEAASDGADVRLDMDMDYDAAEKADYRLTIPYLSTPLAKLTRQQDDGRGQVAALLGSPDRTKTHRALLSEGGEQHFYPSMMACIQAVASGAADFTYVYPYTAQRYMEDTGDDLSVTLLPQYEVSFAIGVAARTDPRLLTILNKAVASVNADYTNQVILRQMTAQNRPVTLTGFLKRYPHAKEGAFFLLVVVASLVFVSVNRQHTLRLIREKNGELQAAMQKALAADEAKTRFLSNVSHDMRTPLNGILGFTNFALQETDPAKKQEHLQKVQQSGEILLDLINNTLEVSRIESGRFNLDPEAQRLRELIERVVAVIEGAAAKKGLRLVTAIHCPAADAVWVDGLKLQEIFLNLLSNAVKYTASGGEVRLTVDWLEPPVAGKNLRVAVEDTGIGISADFLPRIYDSFSQERRLEQSQGMGSGLGLSIVKRIVALMKGTIEVQSELGKGTQFTVCLPMELLPEQTGTASAKAAAPCDFTGRKVLLCEDNELNIEIAEMLLTSWKLTVVCAKDGQEGVERFAASAPGEFAAVLMDIHMPVLDGYAATRQIRLLARPDASSVPIIAMTADAYAEDVQRCLAAGMNAHVAKPIDAAVLHQTLADIWKEKEAQPS